MALFIIFSFVSIPIITLNTMIQLNIISISYNTNNDNSNGNNDNAMTNGSNDSTNTDGNFTTMTKLSTLYKVFERC